MTQKTRPYLTHLSDRHRKVLETYVRRAKRAGIRNSHEVHAVRKGIELLEEKMKQDKKWL